MKAEADRLAKRQDEGALNRFGYPVHEAHGPQETEGLAKERACKQTRVKGKTEDWVMVP